jgi:hypothetical protein
MLPMDWLAVALWIAAIVGMLALAWEPWRRTRRQPSIDLSDDAVGRAVSPLYIFVLPAAVAVGPFFAQIVRHDGVNVWRQPHLLLPHALVGLAVFVAFQAYLRGRILAVVRKQREAKAQALAALNAGRRS